jgi:16S rRNA (uracil1498-N3)-methyltransferase
MQMMPRIASLLRNSRNTANMRHHANQAEGRRKVCNFSCPLLNLFYDGQEYFFISCHGMTSRKEKKMYRFFVESGISSGKNIRITGDDYNHIKNVLRMKPGENVLLSDGNDREYLCRIEGFTDGEVLCAIEDIIGTSRELPVKITLFQGLPKGDKMEQIIQKAVELGVHEIVPVAMKRSVVKLDAKKAAKKVDRWNGIALSAAKQSKRGVIPTVTEVISFGEAVVKAGEKEAFLLPYENAEGMAGSRRLVASMKGKKSIAIFIGPEGGFDDSEVEKAQECGAKTLTLGKRILRTETAGMTMLSILMFSLEDDEEQEN